MTLQVESSWLGVSRRAKNGQTSLEADYQDIKLATMLMTCSICKTVLKVSLSLFFYLIINPKNTKMNTLIKRDIIISISGITYYRLLLESYKTENTELSTELSLHDIW